jgi:transcriptional activator HAC1
MSPHMAPSSAGHRTSLSLDQTRHSAAMLCDLQCRSSEMDSVSRWSQTMLYLMHLNLMIFYKSLMVALWTLWPTRMGTMVTRISGNSTASSTLMTPTITRRTQRRRPTANMISSTRQPLASRTLFSLLNLLSQRLPASVTTAQPFATGPRFLGVSALQALPFSESESKHQGREVFERAMVDMLRRVAAGGHVGSSGSSGASLGKSLSEEQKKSGGIG